MYAKKRCLRAEQQAALFIFYFLYMPPTTPLAPAEFHCNFSDPITYNGTPPTSKQDAWQYASTTCNYTGVFFSHEVYAPTTTISSSTDIVAVGSFSAGEMMISVLLFVLILLQLGQYLAQALRRVRTGKKFLSYSGGDVEIRHDL